MTKIPLIFILCFSSLHSMHVPYMAKFTEDILKGTFLTGTVLISGSAGFCIYWYIRDSRKEKMTTT